MFFRQMPCFRSLTSITTTCVYNSGQRTREKMTLMEHHRSRRSGSGGKCKGMYHTIRYCCGLSTLVECPLLYRDQ
jgi:hypothetical protein